MNTKMICKISSCITGKIDFSQFFRFHRYFFDLYEFCLSRISRSIFVSRFLLVLVNFCLSWSVFVDFSRFLLIKNSRGIFVDHSRFTSILVDMVNFEPIFVYLSILVCLVNLDLFLWSFRHRYLTKSWTIFTNFIFLFLVVLVESKNFAKIQTSQTRL